MVCMGQYHRKPLHVAAQLDLNRHGAPRLDHVGCDQAADYATRKGMMLAEVEKWLAPNLAYDPEQ